jgi:arylsulfatase A-like enzyme
MESGVDDVVGPYTPDGVSGNLRGELYSAWSIDVPASDNSKVRWPDLMLFTRYHYQTSLVQAEEVSKPDTGTIFNGHHAAPGTNAVILGIRGPGVRPGSYEDETALADVAPTLYRLLGVAAPENVDGKVLDTILSPP